MILDCAGKVAVVTGASSGIGKGIARSLIDAGARVYGTARGEQSLRAVATSLGESFIPVRADSTVATDLDDLAGSITSAGDRVDIVVANAGFSESFALAELDEAHVDRVIDANLKGTILTAGKMLPLMNDGGSIILLSSTMAFRGFPGIGVYSATKAAIRALARSWIVELKERRIRVNVITPGPIETEGMHKMMPSEEASRAFMDQLVQTVPVGRLGQPHDIGNLVLFLTSESGSFINGADIQIDGGSSQI